jgi:hypothetical protein
VIRYCQPVCNELLPTGLQRARVKQPTYCQAPCNEPLVSLPRGVQRNTRAIDRARHRPRPSHRPRQDTTRPGSSTAPGPSTAPRYDPPRLSIAPRPSTAPASRQTGTVDKLIQGRHQGHQPGGVLALPGVDRTCAASHDRAANSWNLWTVGGLRVVGVLSWSVGGWTVWAVGLWSVSNATSVGDESANHRLSRPRGNYLAPSQSQQTVPVSVVERGLTMAC